ncbi:hypothetical protein [Blastochloris viridis]|uniref:Uncharacterized protein n=1 Tax=Blastochloris viridis TaxID=1079 RepID=A0A0H5B7B1_BLAVI|nr:hypothetical protein [Blastochloris viridis]ALK08652.1 hypothetical protein BVIR_859 [Blastochloris viridis]BAR98055.1 hypothetical protein BV133_462 [Blastochloris viridis]CUU41315.1 hypothetical protein BVIRIDIS_03040 [Blastochloris viridis]
MTTTAGLIFTAIIVGFIVAVILYRRQRIESFRRAVLALGGSTTRPGPLPGTVDWAGTEVTAARAIEIVPGVPATFIALMRSAAPAASEDFGTTRADPFLLLRLPAEAIADDAAFRRALAARVPLDGVVYDDTDHAVVMVRALHTGAKVTAFIEAVRAALDPAPRPAEGWRGAVPPISGR